MSTTIISAEIKSSDVPLFEALLKRVKTKSVQIEEKISVESSKKMVDEIQKRKEYIKEYKQYFSKKFR